MNTPGFTAEASLFNGDIYYQATSVATIYGGFIQPALFQPRVDELYVPFCLKPPLCFYDPFGRLRFLPLSGGIRNPITGACE